MEHLKFEIWSSRKLNMRKLRYVKMWYWHLVSITNLGKEIIAQGEPDGYFNRLDCQHGAEIVKSSGNAPIEYINESEL